MRKAWISSKYFIILYLFKIQKKKNLTTLNEQKQKIYKYCRIKILSENLYYNYKQQFLNVNQIKTL